MSSLPVYFQIALKVIISVFVLAFVSIGDADAKPSDKCSANGQKPCPVYYPGEICDSWLDNIGGVCRPCGGAGQPACAKIKRGYPCRGKLEPDSRGRCQPCGGRNQTACRALKAGSRCDPGLEIVGGKCVACGGLNEQACPKIKRGYPCDGKLEPDGGNVCRPCGGNGQRACRALKQGEQCNSWLDKDRADICRPCGGQNQPACSITKKGSICKAGLGKINGACRPCGQLGQPACPALEQGRQCSEWTTQRGGKCVPCGTPATGACRVTDKGKACEEIYDWEFGKCVESVRSITRSKAADTIQQMGGEKLGEAIGFASQLNEDDDVTEDLSNGEVSDDMPSNKLCLGWNEDSSFFHRSWTLGVGGGASAGAGVVGVGVDGEVGAAFRCANRADTKDSKWYASGGWSQAVGATAGAGVTFGMWKADFNALGGASHGYIISISDFAKGYAWLKGVNLGKASFVDGAIGFWYERNEDGSVGDYQGYTVSIGAGVGVSGGSYVKSTTVQYCDYDMDCALRTWREVRKSGSFVDDGVTIIVHERTKQGIDVTITKDGETREDLYFERATITDWRDYKLVEDGDTVERICFRHNFEELKYRDENKDCDWGLTLLADDNAGAPQETSTRSIVRQPVTSEQSTVAAISTLGLWDFEVNGRTLTDEFVEQTDAYVVLRRVGTTLYRRYEKVGANEYRNARGSTFRFVNATRAIWISPDKKTVYQMQKR